MLKWKDEYLLGVPQIDEQHAKLFEIAQRVYELVKNDFRIDKYDEILSIIEELKEYTIFHFKAEEEYMASIGYKKLFSHTIEHNEFIEKVSNVNFKEVDENQDKYILEILEFVVNWIDEHILEKDKLIVSA